MTVLDASAVLALLQGERGADLVAAHARGGLISAVNLIEVRSKLIDAVNDVEAAMRLVSRVRMVVVPFDAEQARIAGDLWPRVRKRDVSLADRACLALAIQRGAAVLTGDRKWTELDIGVDVRLIR